jgi:hypothetical protein
MISLGNAELLNKLITNEIPLDCSTVCSRLKDKLYAGVSLVTEIEFTASHFHELDPTDQKGIDLPVLEQLVSSDSLRLISEDSLLSFMSGLEFESEKVVLRYLRSEYLSPEAVANLLDYFRSPHPLPKLRFPTLYPFPSQESQPMVAG